MTTLTAGRRTLLVLLAGLALLLGGCAENDSDVATSEATSTAQEGEANDPADGETSPAKTYTQEQSGETASLSPSEEAHVTLETCPGCGFHWEITEPTDEAVVKLLESEVSTSGSSGPDGEPIAGNSEMHTFRFQAVASGSTAVTIGYFPPSQQPAEETFTLSFTVA